MKRILVTGGLGFIGSAFLRRFVVERPNIAWLNVDAMTYCADPRRIDGIDKLPCYGARFVDISRWEDVARLVSWAPDTIVHFAAETHVDRSILDPEVFTRTNVVGTLNMPMVIERCLTRQPITIHGDGKNLRDWLHVEDHVSGIWTILERGKLGESHNIGGTEEVSNEDVVNEVCACVADTLDAHVDDFLALKTYVTDRPGNDRRYALDTTKLRALGWAPRRRFDEGVAEVVERAVRRWNR